MNSVPTEDPKTIAGLGAAWIVFGFLFIRAGLKDVRRFKTWTLEEWAAAVKGGRPRNWQRFPVVSRILMWVDRNPRPQYIQHKVAAYLSIPVGLAVLCAGVALMIAALRKLS